MRSHRIFYPRGFLRNRESESIPNEFRAASRWDFLGNSWMSAKPRTTKNRVLSRLGLMITNINLNNMKKQRSVFTLQIYGSFSE